MTRRRHVDKYALFDRAKAAAEAQIRAAGFGDLLGASGELYVITYTNEELRELDEPIGEWVGQYVAGSLEGEHGLTICINIDKHGGVHAMIETLLHEAGHALWELVDEAGREEYAEEGRYHKWGTEEAFADDFMYLCQGLTDMMRAEEIFRAITKVT